MSTLRADVKQDWRWSDGYLAQVRQILLVNAAHFLKVEVANPYQDMRQSTDMVLTLAAQNPTIAVRLRRPYYHYRDLTLRASRASGAVTELAKVRAGYVDLYLYGWTVGTRISEWMLVDMARLRASGLLNRQWRLILNRDGVTGFIAIPYQTLAQNHCILNANMHPKGKSA